MPIQELRPLTIGFYNQLALGAGANKVTAVDPGRPISHDDSTSYIRINIGDADKAESYLFETIPPSAPSINSLKIAVRWENSDNISHTLRTTVRIPTEGAGPNWTRGVGGGWATETPTAANKPGGGVWTTALVNIVDCGFYITEPMNASSVGVTSFWLVCDYTSAPGGFMAVVLSAIPWAWLGASFIERDIVRLAQCVGHTQRTWLRPDELRMTLLELRAHRFPITV
jgi:hypothetical protein